MFFDTLGIDYRYEPEGFDLNGLFYLPDFYLPTEQPASWIEVKPEIPRDPEGNRRRKAVLTWIGISKNSNRVLASKFT